MNNFFLKKYKNYPATFLSKSPERSFWWLDKEPRAQVYYGFGALLGDRNINENDFDWIK